MSPLLLATAVAAWVWFRRGINPDFFTVGHGPSRVIHPIRDSDDYSPEVEQMERERRHEHARAELYRGIRRERYGRLEGGVDRPPWGRRLSERKLRAIAEAHGQRASTEGWWEKAHLWTGSAELKRALGESGVTQVRESRTRVVAPAARSHRRHSAAYDFRHPKDLPF